MGLLAFHWPPLGDDPPSGVPAGKQQYLNITVLLVTAMAYGTILLSRGTAQHQADVLGQTAQKVQRGVFLSK